jgi:hypothetical protein
VSAVVGIDLSSKALDLVKPGMSVSDAAWLAGFLDGEGSFQITLASRRVNFDAAVSAANTHRDALERCRELAGGSICALGRSKSAWRQYYKWEIRGKSVTSTLHAILPYLVIKREQAEILMVLRLSSEAGARLGKSILPEHEVRWRETLKLAINALNTRGTAAPSESAITALAVVRAYIASDDRQLSLLRGAT